MSNGKDGPMPHIEVDDAAAAFHRLEDATRRIMAVPKKEIDKRIAKSKGAKQSRKR